VDQVTSVLTLRPWALVTWPALAMVLGTIVRALLGSRASRLALVPRTAAGLLGILTAPFLHANAAHLVANLPPFVVLGAAILRRGQRVFLTASLTVALASGLLLWLFGRRGAHMGASGVIFGFFGYLMAVAYLSRSAVDVLVAVAVLVIYGSMLAGLRPARASVSFEGHFFGLVAGIGTAWLEHIA